MSLPIRSCLVRPTASLLEAFGGLVGREGVEPSTSRLSGVRSNHLSYRPNPVGPVDPSYLVEPTGIEPVTSCLQSTRSPS